MVINPVMLCFQTNLDLSKRMSARAAKTRALANRAALIPAAEKPAFQKLLNESAYTLYMR